MCIHLVCVFPVLSGCQVGEIGFKLSPKEGWYADSSKVSYCGVPCLKDMSHRYTMPS